MKCLIEELNKIDILPWGWAMLRRTPNTDLEDGFIEIHYTGDTNLIEENANLVERSNRAMTRAVQAEAKLAAIECAGCGKTMLECECDEVE